MNIREFLNRKYLEWQLERGEPTQLDKFAQHVGVSQSLMSMWMNGTRTPGPKNKKRIIELYGIEAVKAFGEDPDLYFIQNNWDDYTPQERRSLREQAEKFSEKNDPKRSHQKGRARKI